MLSIEKIVSLCKQRGIVFPGSEIYGGLANSWDYGPIGVELKNNIKKLWWKDFVQRQKNIVGLDSSVLMNPQVWEASGHLSNFSDPLVDCKNCKHRFRADHLLETSLQKKEIALENLSLGQMDNLILEHRIVCPHCGIKENFSQVRQFNLMFQTEQGVTSDTSDTIYLRPETAQGIFINFKNIATTSRQKLPFGIAQIGKSFRNEITPGNFIFRTREFEQMELEFFCDAKNSLQEFKNWQKFCEAWLLKVGFQKELFRWREHSKDELSHYSKATSDLEFQFPFGWSELWGLAHRGNYDLNQHQEHSGKDLFYTEDAEKILPDCIEPSLGVDRLFLALLCNGYTEEKLETETRTVLKLIPELAPIKVAILPLSKKLSEESIKIFDCLVSHFACDHDESGSIGKRYRRQDEIGTPFCITFDFESLEDKKVTVRERDTMEQERVEISELKNYLAQKITF